MSRYSRRQTFVVMPSRGIADAAMQASIFGNGAADLLSAELLRKVDPFARANVSAVVASAPAAKIELSERIEPNDFEIISQRFRDGPATVSMSHAARMAIEASHPSLRVFPLTRYHLPGRRPTRRPRAGASGAAAAGARPKERRATAASAPSAESAAAADGKVFVDDAKQYYLKGGGAGAQGQGVMVGILDTGIDATHPALESRIAALRCYIPGVDAGAGGPADLGSANESQAGHGTHVAGIVAAAPGFGGPAGVAPKAQLISYRIFPDDPLGRAAATNPVIIDSIRAAIEDGCHIVNLSIEGVQKEDGVRSAVEDAWQNGVVCIAAAGNGFGNPVGFPAALQHCIAVTAIGRDGCFPDKPSFKRHVSNTRATSDAAVFLAKFSNYGPQVQFTAPGHAIVSTFPGGQWWFDSGTSMSAPFITGLLARLLSDNGNILNMAGNAQRSAAMLQMLVGRAHVLGLPQIAQEGYGLPI